MPKNGQIIVAPVDVVRDVASILGVSSGDVGYLCSNAHRRINKWSKHKPVRFNKIKELTDAEFAAEDGNFGLSFPSASSAKNFKDLYAIQGFWDYLPPNRDSDAKRITDFNNYYHNAKPVVYTRWPKDKIIVYDLFQAGDFINIGVRSAADDRELSLADFKNTGGNDLYYGRLAVQVYHIEPVTTPQANWHDTSKWNGPENLTGADGGVGTTVQNDTGYIGLGYNYVSFKINSMPSQILSEDVRPIYVIVLGILSNNGKYPLPTDKNNYSYCFLRPYLLSWVKVNLLNWSFGDKDSSGNLKLFNIHAPGPTPTNWDGTLCAQIQVENKTNNFVYIGSGGSDAQTQFRSRDMSTNNYPVLGQLIDTSGNSISGTVTLGPAGSSDGSYRKNIIIKLPKVMLNPDPNVCYLIPLLVSHNKGQAYTEILNMPICLKGIN